MEKAKSLGVGLYKKLRNGNRLRLGAALPCQGRGQAENRGGSGNPRQGSRKLRAAFGRQLTSDIRRRFASPHFNVFNVLRASLALRWLRFARLMAGISPTLARHLKRCPCIAV
jgi:hypothetical protein